MDLLFDGHSGKEKGTLCHLKNLLNRRSVSKNVSETFNHVSEFLKFVTEGYLVLFGLRILGLDNLDTDIANDFSAMCEMEKQEYLRKLASTILDEIWCPISTTESTRIENDTHEFCFCKEGKHTSKFYCLHLLTLSLFHLLGLLIFYSRLLLICSK